jgi:hypothetical protein
MAQGDLTEHSRPSDGDRISKLYFEMPEFTEIIESVGVNGVEIVDCAPSTDNPAARDRNGLHHCPLPRTMVHEAIAAFFGVTGVIPIA